jgi:hypothetical protein
MNIPLGISQVSHRYLTDISKHSIGGLMEFVIITFVVIILVAMILVPIIFLLGLIKEDTNESYPWVIGLILITWGTGILSLMKVGEYL